MDPIKKTIESYNKFAKNYVEYTFDTILQYQLTQFISFLKGKKILDVGAGSGRDAQYLKEEGLKVTGIELSPEVIKEAKRKTRLSFKEMDMRKLDFKDTGFDGVWCCASFIHLPKKDAEKALKEFHRVLTENGVLYLGLKEGEKEGFESSHKLNNSDVYVSHYVQEEIEEKLRDCDFEIITTYIEKDAEGISWINTFARKLTIKKLDTKK
ncbi:class I SAM-dependent methyltransferase [Candidatus Woesearchaeota archaeon]|nr:class I SAM-dependent methyltransferase [Candidatus Woesearchaeota archaeon]MBL7051106.1 class I SAM-dependent methyltransferase [Candidatus Woesearchaeota archaeon]